MTIAWQMQWQCAFRGAENTLRKRTRISNTNGTVLATSATFRMQCAIVNGSLVLLFSSAETEAAAVHRAAHLEREASVFGVVKRRISQTSECQLPADGKHGSKLENKEVLQTLR